MEEAEEAGGKVETKLPPYQMLLTTLIRVPEQDSWESTLDWLAEYETSFI